MTWYNFSFYPTPNGTAKLIYGESRFVLKIVRNILEDACIFSNQRITNEEEIEKLLKCY